jgi:hypothetical protein
VRGSLSALSLSLVDYVLQLVLQLHYTHVKWVPVTTAWRVLRLRMEERPPIWRVAANKLNKQCGQPTRGGPPAWGLGEVLTTLPVKIHVK